ncbi:dihydroorotate dehydrogenase electron transfer subunit [Fusibacter tunisiensis]|uniref:Dihydroorotate dehydrogenase electron transfer subunit n=1 Tax=Fusibacter tunisiensis TaxID=1008308 RepID=A0ABS2MR41_9FIRM|nr:dihydroorotate dehydrogenase electron transfer subunit [Fusibacter tunisiensis]MBM7561841.1 dihydroorotate dehydrogenase electron transfer subunit [Fusibacter tunisiensis]
MFLGVVKVICSKALSEDIFEVRVERPKELAHIQPGQFFMLTANAYLLKRPISVSDFTSTQIVFTIREVGEGTKSLIDLPEIQIMGPLGHGFEVTKAHNVLLIGGGIGVAPLLPIAKKCKENQSKIYSTLGFRGEPVMEEVFDSISDFLGIVSETSNKYENGYVTSLADLVLRLNEIEMIYACGPKKMMAEVAKLSEKYEVPAQLLLEEKMACGIGACLGCTCKTKEGAFGFKHSKVCKDGPMFWASEVIFDV